MMKRVGGCMKLKAWIFLLVSVPFSCGRSTTTITSQQQLEDFTTDLPATTDIPLTSNPSPPSSMSPVGPPPAVFSSASTCLEAFDANKDGHLDLEEFTTLIQTLYPEENGNETLNGNVTQPQNSTFDPKVTQDLFATFDALHLNDGKLNTKTFDRFYTQFIQKIVRPVSALILVDVQNDFISGTLTVPEAADIVDPINTLLDTVPFDHIFISQDWHPTDHVSFIDNVHLRKLAPTSKIQNASLAKTFDTVVFDLDKKGFIEQKLWPRHCVQESWGAELHPRMKVKEGSIYIRKGVNPDIDSYSALWDNNKFEATKLIGELQEKGVTDCYVCGLATDVCVGSTALHSLELGYKTILIEDASRGISPEGIAEKKSKIVEGHGIVVQSGEVENLVRGNVRSPQLGLKLAMDIIKKNQID